MVKDSAFVCIPTLHPLTLNPSPKGQGTLEKVPFSPFWEKGLGDEGKTYKSEDALSTLFLLGIQEQLVQPSNFDRTRWDHWLLIVCFITIAACGCSGWPDTGTDKK